MVAIGGESNGDFSIGEGTKAGKETLKPNFFKYAVIAGELAGTDHASITACVRACAGKVSLKNLG